MVLPSDILTFMPFVVGVVLVLVNVDAAEDEHQVESRNGDRLQLFIQPTRADALEGVGEAARNTRAVPDYVRDDATIAVSHLGSQAIDAPFRSSV